MKAPSNRLPQQITPPARPRPEYCTVGDVLCEVRLWTQEQWDAASMDRRPMKAERVPGLGWVLAVPAGRPE